jgi:hypothetical protein
VDETHLLLQAIAAVYDAAVGENSWTAALEQFNTLTGGVPADPLFRSSIGASGFNRVSRTPDSEIDRSTLDHYADPVRSRAVAASDCRYIDHS